MTTENKRFIQRLYDAFKEGDVETVIGALDEGIEWTEAAGFPTAGTYTSPQEVLEGVFGPLIQAVPDFQVVPDALVAEGDHVVSLGSYMGTHQETGQSFETRFAHHWTIEDGKVTRFEQVTDTVPVQEAFLGTDLI